MIEAYLFLVSLIHTQQILCTLSSFSYLRSMQCFSRNSLVDGSMMSVCPLTTHTLNANYLPLKIVLKDDHLPMHVEKASERDAILDLVWLSSSESSEIVLCVITSGSSISMLISLKEHPTSKLSVVTNILYVLPRCK